jgi:hypothetical protein
MSRENLPGIIIPECGSTATVVLEGGMITVRCTLPVHEGYDHYDDVFGLGWREERE